VGKESDTIGWREVHSGQSNIPNVILQNVMSALILETCFILMPFKAGHSILLG
jgi:hypothetical protein